MPPGWLLHGCPLLVLTVQDPNRFLSLEEGIQLEAAMRLCEDLGAEFLRMDSSDVLGTIARIAGERRITQIVMGQTLRSRRQALLRRTLSERLQHTVSRGCRWICT